MQSPNAFEEAKKTLEKRFGHPSVVADAFRNKLENWPKIPPKDGIALREYADFLKSCELAFHLFLDLETLNTQHENRMLVSVLPSWAHPKWGSRVRDCQLKNGENTFPPFANFVSFVTEIADVQCLPVLTGLSPSSSNKDKLGSRRGPGASAFSTGVREGAQPKKEGKGKKCDFCEANHDLNSCHKFVSKPVKERTRFIIKRGLCLRCLSRGHMVKENKCSVLLNCDRCKGNHPSCLHSDETHAQPDSANSKCTSVCALEDQDGHDQSLIVPVWISHTEHSDL